MLERCKTCGCWECMCPNDHARLRANTEEAAAHLYAALAQSAPSDDEIIIGHIRDALILLGGKDPR